MSVVSARLGFASALAVLFFAGAVHAQSVPYWTSAWPGGFGSLTSDPGANDLGVDRRFGARPHLEHAVCVHAADGVVRFHGRVGEIGQLVKRIDNMRRL